MTYTCPLNTLQAKTLVSNMPRLAISDEQFESLFVEMRELTENFARFEPRMLAEKPARILVLRILLGYSQEKFEERLGKNRGNTTKYERGMITRMRLSTASEIINFFLNHKLVHPTLQGFLNNLRTLRAESKGWFQAHTGESQATTAARRGAISLLSKLSTDQELMVSGALRSKGVVVQTNHVLDPNNAITADVFVDGVLQTVIQCRQIKSRNRDTHRRAIEDLAYQGFRVRKYLPNARIVAFLESDIPLTNSETFLLNESYDAVVGGTEPLLSLLLGV
jgi:transcriptional regulator with XRE-family HTH domain